MGANYPWADEARDPSTMARPTQPEHRGRAFFFARRGAGQVRDSVFHRAVDRLLEVAPFLTTLLLVAVYPLLRYLLRDPFPAELFRFAFIAFWIGFLIVNMIRAQKTRQTVLQNLNTDWLGRLRSAAAPLSHYVIFMPLKNESNRHVLFQTFRSVERLNYPKSLVTLMPIVEAEDQVTLERLSEVVSAFAPRIRVEPFVYPTDGLPVKCKATSVTMAGRHVAERVDRGEFQPGPGGVKILIVDTDTILHEQDLGFRETTHRDEEATAAARGLRGVVLQSLTTYTANDWKVPMLPRLHNTGFVLYQMGKMQTQGDYLVLGPGTSLDLQAFRAVDYFEPNRHNKDMQFRYKVVMEGYRVAPLKIPTWGQAPPHHARILGPDRPLGAGGRGCEVRGALSPEVSSRVRDVLPEQDLPGAPRPPGERHAAADRPLAGAAHPDLLDQPLRPRVVAGAGVPLAGRARPEARREEPVRQLDGGVQPDLPDDRPHLVHAPGNGGHPAHHEADHLPAHAAPLAWDAHVRGVVLVGLLSDQPTRLFLDGHGPALHAGEARVGSPHRAHAGHAEMTGRGGRRQKPPRGIDRPRETAEA